MAKSLLWKFAGRVRQPAPPPLPEFRPASFTKNPNPMPQIIIVPRDPIPAVEQKLAAATMAAPISISRDSQLPTDLAHRKLSEVAKTLPRRPFGPALPPEPESPRSEDGAISPRDRETHPWALADGAPVMFSPADWVKRAHPRQELDLQPAHVPASPVGRRIRQWETHFPKLVVT